MPFGLRNVAPEYQRAINNIFDVLIVHSSFVYINKVVIYAKTLNEHKRLFGEVMDRLRRSGWTGSTLTLKRLKQVGSSHSKILSV